MDPYFWSFGVTGSGSRCKSYINPLLRHYTFKKYTKSRLWLDNSFWKPHDLSSRKTVLLMWPGTRSEEGRHPAVGAVGGRPQRREPRHASAPRQPAQRLKPRRDHGSGPALGSFQLDRTLNWFWVEGGLPPTPLHRLPSVTWHYNYYYYYYY